MRITRRELLLGTAATALAIPPGCGGGSSGTDASVACAAPTASIGANHGHVVTLPAADVAAGAMRTYDVTGGTHTHQVTISASQFAMMRDGAAVMIMTTTFDAHEHTITFRCA
jgi:hypothetical protein